MKSLLKYLDKSTINSSTSGIDTEYVLGSGTDVESELQVDEGNDNSEMEDNDLEDDELSEME